MEISKNLQVCAFVELRSFMLKGGLILLFQFIILGNNCKRTFY